MRQRLLVVFLVALLALVVGAVQLSRSRPAADLLCRWITEQAGERLDGTLAIGRCEIAPLRARLTFHDVALDLPRDGLALTVERVGLRLRDFQGFRDPVRVQSIEVVRPHLVWTAGRGGGEPAALPCALPPVPLDLVEATMSDGAVDVDLGGRRLHAGGVSLDFARRGDHHAGSLTADALGWEDAPAPPGRLEAQVRLDPEDDRIDLERIALVAAEASVSLRGRVAWACTPTLDATAVAEGDVGRLLELLGLAERVPARGRLALTARIAGPWNDPVAEGSLEATDAGFAFSRLGHVRAEGRVADGVLTIREAVTDAVGGRVRATGTVGLTPHAPIDVSLDAEGGSLEGLVWALGGPRSWAGGGLDGRVDLKGPLVPPDLAGRADLRLTDFVVLDRPVAGGRGTGTSFLQIADARVAGQMHLGPEGIAVPEGAVQLPRSRGRFVGDFPFSLDRPVSVELDVSQAHLADFGRVAGLGFDGLLSGRVSLGGPYDDPRIEAQVQARGFELDGLEAGVAMARVRYEDLRLAVSSAHGQRGHTPYEIDRLVLRLGEDPVHLDLDLSTAEGRVEDVVAALRHYHPIAERLVGARGRVRGSVRISGPLGRMTTTVDAIATDGEILGQPFSRVRGKLRFFEEHRWELGEVRLALEGGGSLTARGFADMTGDLGLSVSGREVPVEAVAPLTGLPLAGRVSGDLVLQGTWAHPTAQGALSLSAGRFDDVPLRPARLGVVLDGPRLTLSGEWSGAAVSGEAWAALDPSQAFGLDLRVDEPDLGRWRPLLAAAGWDGAEGAVAGRVQLTGRRDSPESLAGEVALTHLAVRRPGAQLQTPGPARLVLEGGWVSTDDLELAVGGARVAAAGRVALDGRLDLGLRGTGGLDLLSGRVPGLLDAEGAVEAEATVTGTVEAPMIIGSAELRGGALSFEDVPLRLTRLDGRLAFSQHRVVVERLTGRAGGGRVRLGGEVALEDLRPERLHLTGRFDEVRYAEGGLDATLSGELWLEGPPDDPKLVGRAKVLRARYERDFGLEELLPSMRRKVGEAVPVERDPLARLDVTVSVPGTLVLDGRGLHARLRGEVQVLGTDARPGLLGTLSTTEARAELRGNEWQATHAVLDFKDSGRIAPSFDVHAESDVRDYRVYVHAYGTPADPRVTLTSEPELPEIDVLTLVTLGVTTRDAEGLGGEDAAAAAADALFAISGLDRQVREFIPSNRILRDPSLRLTSGYSRYTGQVEPRLSFESRVFVDELRLRYSAPLSTAGQRTQAEYRITDMVSVQAEWDTEESEGTLGNLGLDLKLRWEGE